MDIHFEGILKKKKNNIIKPQSQPKKNPQNVLSFIFGLHILRDHRVWGFRFVTGFCLFPLFRLHAANAIANRVAVVRPKSRTSTFSPLRRPAGRTVLPLTRSA